MKRNIIYNASVSKVDRPKGPRPSETGELNFNFELAKIKLNELVNERELEEILGDAVKGMILKDTKQEGGRVAG